MQDGRFDFIKNEENIQNYWDENKAFEKSNELSSGRKEYTFYDGPPFATGLPHYGHILSGTIKDTVTRFFYQQGYRVERRFGWDCHGLPVEYEIDKKLGINSRKDVHRMGIGNYNDACRGIVMTYSKEWERIVKRMGRWVDFNGGYKTMDLSFMESVWRIFKMFFDKGYVYRGYKVMPFSTACSTPLSNFEANQNYKDVCDPSILIAFPLKRTFRGKTISLIAWTTTPWTLPSNCALVVKRCFIYAIFQHKERFYAMLESRIKEYFPESTISDRFSGSELLDEEYEQPFSYYEDLRGRGFFRVISADFVSDADGTGIVHCAPGFGEDDYRAFVDCNLIKENDLVPCPVDEKGCFTSEVQAYSGKYVKDCDKLILRDLKEKVLQNNRMYHRYPFCWRSDTPLLYKIVPNWFIKVRDNVEGLLRNNEFVNWIPESVKYKKFHNWLESAKDWAISRNRFWGTPIPLWVTEDYSDIICIGSVSELEELGKRKIADIHREWIDDIVIVKDGREYRRVDEVLDCWFESGSMPYAQNHWPFNGRDLNDTFPADFIAEGADQTRGWFYTLHVISTLLFDKPAFKNVIVNGIVLAEDGRKMSKRLKNYPDPMDVVNRYGADSLRMYLLSSPVVVAENLRFSENGVKEVFKNLIIPWQNSLNFYIECRPFEKDTSFLQMDDWILNSFNNLLSKVVKEMKEYRLSSVLQDVYRFVDDLRNWYIRMNRKEMRGGMSRVLRETLTAFSIVMAPFTPFFSEYSYQQLVPSEKFDSVHFKAYPSPKELGEHPFDKAKVVIEGVRYLREVNKISLKTPLNSVKVICELEYEDSLAQYEREIKNECNLLNVVFCREESYKFKCSVKPNFGKIGDKEKSIKKEKICHINKLTTEELEEIMNSGKLEFKNYSISKEEIVYSKEIIGEDGKYKSFGPFSLILDTNIDKELIDMKEAREFNSFVQKLRKRASLKIGDDAWVSVENKDLLDLVSKFYSLQIGGKDGELLDQDIFTYKGEKVDVYLYK
jgi:isoleucyl-tRNA synthetase